MLGPFTTASRLTPIHQMSLAVLSRAACASMSTTTTTTTTTTRDRGDHYGLMEWAQIGYRLSLTLPESDSKDVFWTIFGRRILLCWPVDDKTAGLPLIGHEDSCLVCRQRGREVPRLF